MGKFENKVVIVTGAGQGAGKKLAIRFYEEGAVVGLLDLNGQNLDAVVREVNPDTGRFLAYAVDVSDNRQVTSAIDDIGKRFGRIDILINNAGVLHKGMIESSTDTHMKLMVDVNLMGPMYCTHASVPYMKENGGNIINVSSILATFSRSFFADSSYMLSFSVLCSCVCSRLISPSVSSWHKQDNTLMHQSPGHIQRRTPYNF